MPKKSKLLREVPHYRRPRLDFQIVTEGKTMDQIAEQVAFKWRRTLIVWTHNEEEGYLSVKLTNLVHKIRIELKGDHMPKKTTPPAALPRAESEPRGAASSSKEKKVPGKFEGPDAMFRTAEMVAQDHNGQVMQYKFYEETNTLVVLLMDGRKYLIDYPPKMVPKL